MKWRLTALFVAVPLLVLASYWTHHWLTQIVVATAFAVGVTIGDFGGRLRSANGRSQPPRSR